MPLSPPGCAFIGETTLSSGQVIAHSTGGGVFSADGRHVAVPIWQQDGRGHYTKNSSVRIVSLATGASRDLAPVVEGSLTLYSLDSGAVCGVSNLEEKPADFAASVGDCP
jgi:hypothetical protein